MSLINQVYPVIIKQDYSRRGCVSKIAWADPALDAVMVIIGDLSIQPFNLEQHYKRDLTLVEGESK